jgi:hypothetical protein
MKPTLLIPNRRCLNDGSARSSLTSVPLPSFILTPLGLTGRNPRTSAQIVHVRFGSTRARNRFTAAFEDDEPDSADG